MDFGNFGYFKIMLTPITILSTRIAHTHMQNRLRNCHLGIVESCNETSIRMIETRKFWENHHTKLAQFAPTYLDSLFDIALHPYAIAGQADQATWCMHGGQRRTAEGRTVWMDPAVEIDGEFGHLESKLTSMRAVELIGVMAKQYPQAFDSHHVEKLLDVAGLTETGNLGSGPDYSLYHTVLKLSTDNPSIFTENQKEEMHKRRKLSDDDNYSVALFILDEQQQQLPLQGALSPTRPKGEVVYVSFRKSEVPKV